MIKTLMIQYKKTFNSFGFLMLILFVAIFQVANSQTISPTNGGAVGMMISPPGWSQGTGTTDIVNHATYLAQAYSGGALPAVPTGHATFIAGFVDETTTTTVTGLVPGNVYSVDFYLLGVGVASHASITCFKITSAGINTFFTYFTPRVWQLKTYTFTATATTKLLSFGGCGTGVFVFSIPTNAVTDITSLPIGLIDFNATIINNDVQLGWKTQSERNNERFVVQRSIDGSVWSEVDVIDGAGNSGSLIEYSSKDLAPLPGLSYYRLKQIDFDGEFTFSSVVTIDRNSVNGEKVSIHPNPTAGSILVNSNNIENQDIEIYNCLFENVTHSIQKKSMSVSWVTLDLSNLPSGVYYLKTNNVFEKIVKQ